MESDSLLALRFAQASRGDCALLTGKATTPPLFFFQNLVFLISQQGKKQE
jgi:hypothetical protein